MLSIQIQLARGVRFGLDKCTRSNFIQIRKMGRRGSPLVYKKVFNEQGETVDSSRLGQLKNTIDETNIQHGIITDQVKKAKIKSKPMADDISAEYKLPETKLSRSDSDKPNKKKKLKKEDEAMKLEDIEEEEEIYEINQKRDFHVPHYTKIYGWDKSNKHLKELGQNLSHNHPKTDYVVLEGKRLINDALDSGLQPSILIFSQVKLLKDIPTQNIDSSCEFYHVPYTNIKMWSDLTTPTGVMAAFSKEQIINSAVSTDSLPITLICDNVRTPDNLGSLMRVAAGAGVNKILLTPGCVSMWNRKVMRSAAGVHFKVPMVEKVDWEQIRNHIDPYPQVIICDLMQENEANISEKERLQRVYDLENTDLEEIGDDDLTKEENKQLLESKYSQIPISSTPYNKFHLSPGIKDVVVVVGGETEGVSNAAYKFSHQLNGTRLHIPLRNGLNSLNVVSATSVALFTIQQQLI